jgi:hypothetical protein
MKKYRPRTNYESHYGIDKTQWCQQEQVGTWSLTDRHVRFGSIWQRKHKPTSFEVTWGCTPYEMAQMLPGNPEPHKLYRRHKDGYLDVRAPGAQLPDMSKAEPRQRFWLHHNHPDYVAARGGLDSWTQ